MTNTPTPEEVRNARIGAGLTQSQAAAIIGTCLNSWQRYEGRGGDRGNRTIPPAKWELFLMKTRVGGLYE